MRFFAEHQEALSAALDVSVTEYDELAELTSLEFTSVAAAASGVEVRYAVRWSSIHACSDQRARGTSARVLRGRVDGTSWVFERHVPLPGRDTIDEF